MISLYKGMEIHLIRHELVLVLVMRNAINARTFFQFHCFFLSIILHINNNHKPSEIKSLNSTRHNSLHSEKLNLLIYSSALTSNIIYLRYLRQTEC